MHPKAVCRRQADSRRLWDGRLISMLLGMPKKYANGFHTLRKLDVHSVDMFN